MQVLMVSVKSEKLESCQRDT